MIRSLLVSIMLLSLCGCVSKKVLTTVNMDNPYNEVLLKGLPSYGFLECDDYQYYETQKAKNLAGLTLNLEIKDLRRDNKIAECVNFELDRNTELEGRLGLGLVSDYVTRSLTESNAKLTSGAKDKILIEWLCFLKALV